MISTSQSSTFIYHLIPVIVLYHAPFFLLAFLTAQTRVNFFSRERDEFGFDPRIITLFEDHVDQF